MLKRTFAALAAASLLSGAGVSLAHANGSDEPSLNYTVGEQIDGWAPVMVAAQCGDGAKHAVVALSPAASVKLVGETKGEERDGALRVQYPATNGQVELNLTASMTGQVTFSISCVHDYNYSSASRTTERVIDAAKPVAEDGAPQVKAAATGAKVVAGGEVKLSVAGFDSEEGLSVDMYSTPVNLAKTKADKDGKAELTVRIPENTTEGVHHIVVTGETSGLRAITAVKVVKAEASQGKGDAAKKAAPKSGKQAGRPGLPRTGA